MPIERKLQIKIPPGVDTGSQLRITGEGEPGAQGGPPGDLYVVVRVEEHDFFQREGTSLFCEVPISFAQAALGASVEVPTPDGEQGQALTIPEGTQTGADLPGPRQGRAPPRRKGRGDLHVTVRVVVPDALSGEQRKLIEQLAKTLPEEAAAQDKARIRRAGSRTAGLRRRAAQQRLGLPNPRSKKSGGRPRSPAWSGIEPRTPGSRRRRRPRLLRGRGTTRRRACGRVLGVAVEPTRCRRSTGWRGSARTSGPSPWAAFWIAPAWDHDPEPPDGALLVDPGRAFGTGTHESTRCACRRSSRLAAARPWAACSTSARASGILAIAAARLGADPVVGADNDPRPSTRRASTRG